MLHLDGVPLTTAQAVNQALAGTPQAPTVYVSGGPATGAFKNDLGSKRSGRFARWRREVAKKLRPNCAAVDWLGMIPPAHLAMKDKPLRYSRRLVESRQRPKKPDPSLL